MDPRHMCKAFAVAAALAAAAPAFAGSMELVDANGTSSGWTATWAPAYDGAVNLTYKATTGSDFFFQKAVTLTPATAKGIEIVFQRVADVPAKTLVINDEVVQNNTGNDWNGFNIVVATGTTGNSPNFALMNTDGNADLNGWSILPFTSFTFADQNTRLSVSGGTVANGTAWTPGSTSAGTAGLAIVASANSDNFTLKEIPNVNAIPPGPGPTPIPLPAAAWTGLSTLAGLALFGRRARKV